MLFQCIFYCEDHCYKLPSFNMRHK